MARTGSLVIRDGGCPVLPDGRPLPAWIHGACRREPSGPGVAVGNVGRAHLRHSGPGRSLRAARVGGTVRHGHRVPGTVGQRQDRAAGRGNVHPSGRTGHADQGAGTRGRRADGGHGDAGRCVGCARCRVRVRVPRGGDRHREQARGERPQRGGVCHARDGPRPGLQGRPGLLGLPRRRAGRGLPRDPARRRADHDAWRHHHDLHGPGPADHRVLHQRRADDRAVLLDGRAGHRPVRRRARRGPARSAGHALRFVVDGRRRQLHRGPRQDRQVRGPHRGRAQQHRRRERTGLERRREGDGERSARQGQDGRAAGRDLPGPQRLRQQHRDQREAV